MTSLWKSHVMEESVRIFSSLISDTLRAPQYIFSFVWKMNQVISTVSFNLKTFTLSILLNISDSKDSSLNLIQHYWNCVLKIDLERAEEVWMIEEIGVFIYTQLIWCQSEPTVWYFLLYETLTWGVTSLNPLLFYWC